MSDSKKKMTFAVNARRIDTHGSEATCKSASITLDTDHRIELLHENVMKYGTVFNTVAPGTRLSGVIQRADKSNNRD